MPSYTNLSCIESLVDIRDSCSDQSGVEFFLDDLGLSLAFAGKIADQRYLTGRNLVDNKVRIALDEVYSHLTRNLSPTCDFDKANGILCERASQIARAIWYKTAALIYKEQVVDSNKYNEVIQFAGSEAIGQMLLYDSSFRIFTNAEHVPAGRYQMELDKLENIRAYLEQQCCLECTGSNWSITLP